METQACALCGAIDWCGRPCMRDPGRRNGLLFWPDGREKTLRERGLGFDDPPVRVSGVRKRPSKVLRAVVGATEKAGATEIHATEKVATEIRAGDATEKKRGRPTSGGLTSTERSRLRRERLKVARRALEGGGVGGGSGKD